MNTLKHNRVRGQQILCLLGLIINNKCAAQLDYLLEALHRATYYNQLTTVLKLLDTHELF